MKKIELSTQFFKDNMIDKLVDGFASACELYSVVLDINGKILIEPSGPTPYLGEFYEIVRNPKYNPMYMDVVTKIIDTRESMFCEIDDGNPESRFAASPIFLDGRYIATWILYAHNNVQNQKLFKSYERQSKMAEVISSLLTKLYDGFGMTDDGESIKTELEFEHEQKRILKDLLGVVTKGDKSDVWNMYGRVGSLLDVDYIVYYVFDKENPGRMKLVDYWAKQGKSAEAEAVFSWNHDHYSVELQEKIRCEGLFVDENNMTNQMRVEVFKGGAKAVMVLPIFVKEEYKGRLIFIENTKERRWTKQEMSFAQEISEMLEGDLTIRKQSKSEGKTLGIFRNIANSISDMILARDVSTGKTIFVNDAFKLKLGFDLTGEDSYRIFPRTMDKTSGFEVENIKASHFRNVKYKRYVDRLGGIYDITENYISRQDGVIVSVLTITPDTDNK